MAGRFAGRINRATHKEFSARMCQDPPPVNINRPNEVGFPICRRMDGSFTRGDASEGTPVAVSVSTECPPDSELAGIFHTHPGGVAMPSQKDVSEARRVGAEHVCIGVPDKGHLSCFNVFA